MEALVTGGYGFIGSHVVEKFYKEGYNVVIVDNLTTGSKENVKCEHKFFEMSVCDNKCERIFQSHKFDVVVHLAANIDIKKSIDSPEEDANINLVGLVNMLNLSSKYGVKKFIFGSSATVYGDNTQLPFHEQSKCIPISPYGMSKYVGEFYCKKWKEQYGLDTVCLRLSNVYGPRQSIRGEGGVISMFLQQAYYGKTLKLYGDGEQTRDFIYVGDVAEAFFRATGYTLKERYNISTNQSYSVNHIIEIIKSIHGEVCVEKFEKTPRDIKHSRLDNSEFSKEFDWIIKNNLEFGISKTYNWYKKELSKKKMKSIFKNEDKKNNLVETVRPYVENIAAFFGTEALIGILGFLPNANIFFRVIYLMLVAEFFGFRQSSIATVLTCISVIVRYTITGKDISYFFYDTSALFFIVSYFIIGVGFGYYVDKKNYRIEMLKDEKEIVIEEKKFLEKMYMRLSEVKNNLHEQILDSNDSFGKIYRVTSELNEMLPENIFNASVKVLQDIIKTKQVSIYVSDRSGYYLRLVAQSSIEMEEPRSLNLEEYYELRDAAELGEVFINTKMKNGLPILAAPIIENNTLIAYVLVRTVEFEHLTSYYIHLFKVVTGLIKNALATAYHYQELYKDEMFFEGTNIITTEYFTDIIESKKQAKEAEYADFTLLKLDIKKQDLDDMKANLENCVRKSDYVGVREDDYVYILLNNSGSVGVEMVMSRLTNQGIAATIETGEI